MTRSLPTLDDHTRTLPADLATVLRHLAHAGKSIAHDVRLAALGGALGATGDRNVQGEEVQALDVIANRALIRLLRETGLVCALGSEEEDDVITADKGDFVVLFDPLDGSSNIDVGVSIGTIFGIHRRTTKSGPGTAADCLQVGRKQLAAGYVMYGSSTMLVLTTGHGVDGFTLDPAVGEFFLTHPHIEIPKRGKTYSINEGNEHAWHDGTRRWIDSLKSPPARGLRYVGTLVADFHRTLLKGGIFAYPADNKAPRGKLRLLYEAAPLALIAEQAGGAASDGARPILDLVPTSLHERIPLYIGSADDVADAVHAHR